VSSEKTGGPAQWEKTVAQAFQPVEGAGASRRLTKERTTLMEKPEHHIFVCMSFRGLEPKGKCIKKNAPELLGYLESELADRGMDSVMVSTTGCLKLCEKGPVVLVYPEGYWYQGVEGEEAIDAILDALENGGPAKDYLVG
jgi:(2Fe-2S) ferredoxin